MKEIGLKLRILKEENASKFIITTDEETIEKYPQEISTYAFFDAFGMYTHKLLFADGRQEFFIENRQGELIFYLERMDNAEDFRSDGNDIYYKKNKKWFVYWPDIEEEECEITNAFHISSITNKPTPSPIN